MPRCRILVGSLAAYLLSHVSPNAITEASQACSERITLFVADLDRTLDRKPQGLEDVQRLMNRHFPIKGCDLQHAVSEASRSKYFQNITNQSRLIILSFEGNGFEISFGIWKETGNTYLESAGVKK